MRSIHWLRTFCTTSPPQRSQCPSTTSSFGKADLAGGAEVDRDLRLIGKAVLKELQEDPLGPFIIVGVGGVHLARPVKREAEPLQLAAEAGDVLLRDFCRDECPF